jgi:hypothetical protein
MFFTREKTLFIAQYRTSADGELYNNIKKTPAIPYNCIFSLAGSPLVYIAPAIQLINVMVIGSRLSEKPPIENNESGVLKSLINKKGTFFIISRCERNEYAAIKNEIWINNPRLQQKTKNG